MASISCVVGFLTFFFSGVGSGQRAVDKITGNTLMCSQLPSKQFEFTMFTVFGVSLSKVTLFDDADNVDIVCCSSPT